MQLFLYQSLSFVILPQFLLVFLVIGFSSWDKVFEEYAVIDDLYMEDEECPEASYSDTVHVVITDNFLAVSDFIQALGILDLQDRVPDGVKCLSRQLAD